jgi:hypothetical protein
MKGKEIRIRSNIKKEERKQKKIVPRRGRKRHRDGRGG